MKGRRVDMIRAALLNTFIGLYSLLLCLAAIPVSVFDRTGRLTHSWFAVPWAKGILRASGVRAELRGKENADPGAARIYVCNHQSFFDIFVLLSTLPVNFKFVLKQELMKIPILGFTMKRARYIAIDRSNPRSAARSMNLAVERIKEGASLVVFPEGTRSEDGRLQPFKKGGFLLSLKSGCPLVPVTISGTNRIAAKGSLCIRPGKVTVTIGEAVPVEGYNKRNLNELVELIWGVMARQMVEEEPPS
jgi:1-acyl-sn-glycerol-3-phosphate acyltransferase